MQSTDSHSKYSNYEWSFIMSNEDFWYRMAERAYSRHDYERCAAICFQWLFSFTEAFDDDAFRYSDDRFVFRSVIEWFSDMILKVFDNEDVSDELRWAIVNKYDQLNRLGTLDNYILFDINDIIETRCWPIDVIDFNALQSEKDKEKGMLKENDKEKEEQPTQNTNTLALAKGSEEEKQKKFLEEHFVCDYEFPSERFKSERIHYPLFKRDSPNLCKRIMPKLRKIVDTSMIRNNKEELLQQLDGLIRATHLQLIKGEAEIATLINDSTIRLIAQMRQDEKFLKWIGDDTQVLDELDKTLSNAIKLKNYCFTKQKSEKPESETDNKSLDSSLPLK